MRPTLTTLMLASSFLALSTCAGCGDCETNYVFQGTVTDQSDSPIDGVTIHFGNEEQGTFSDIEITTDATGNYSYSTSTRARYEGTYLEFSKTGYQTVRSSEFTEDEAGSSACGDVTITRDITMSP